MLFEAKRPSELTEEDLLSLVEGAVAEGKEVDYKIELPGHTDQEKREFLADVSSFANTVGGWLFFGLEETGGIATGVPGCEIEDPDEMIQRLENLVRTSIAPRIPGVEFGGCELGSGRIVVSAQVRRSFISPHRVTFRDHSKFYARNSAGKYPLDVSELRTLFNLSGSYVERLREYRRDRLAAIVTGETPIPLESGGLLILHVLPLSIFDVEKRIDIRMLWENADNLHPLGRASIGRRPVFDGVLVYDGDWRDATRVSGYVLASTSGAIEAVTTSIIRCRTNQGDFVPILEVEGILIQQSGSYIRLLEALRIELPLFVMVTYLGMRGSRLETRRTYLRGLPDITQDEILSPELRVDEYDVEIDELMKPAIDALWNAGGTLGSENYNDEGRWQPRR